MDYRYYISFSKEEQKELLEYLIMHKIKFSEIYSLCTLEILESNVHWNEIFNYIKKNSISFQCEMVPSKKELEESEWLEMRCKWFFDYPQPENDFRTITYSSKDWCEACGDGLVQSDNFRIKKPLQWKHKNFAMLHWIYDEFFVSENAKKVLSSSNLNGFDFKHVSNKDAVFEYDDIFQLSIPTIIQPGMIPFESFCKETKICEKCNSVKYILQGRQLVYKRGVFPDNVDIVKSYESFGSGIICSKRIFISQNFYQVLKNNKLDKNLIFEPIKLIDHLK